MSDAIRGVDPTQAQELLKDGFTYVDVRSEEEFEQGHVPGALNVPFMLRAGGGMTPNPDFTRVMNQAFVKDEQLLLGCRSGGRSRKAAEVLVKEGFSKLADLTTGWEGSRDAFGRAAPGWKAQGLPEEKGLPEGQRYSDVQSRRS